MKTYFSRPILAVLVCLLLLCPGLSAQEEPDTVQTEVSGKQYKPREQKLYFDIPLAITEITAINLFGNLYWRLWGPDSEAAYFTLESIRYNLQFSAWSWEQGLGVDNFFTNQMLHPLAGTLYFLSARSNNFNYYVSMIGPFLGSVQWETFAETEMPGTNDLITTFSGGFVLGEILHRLFLELDKGGIGARIGASFLSPPDRLTAALRGYGPERGPSRINSAQIVLGFTWYNAGFYERNDRVAFWNNPAFFLDFDLVYGNPFTAHSKTPFDQFDLNTSLTASIPLTYNFTLIANGYLASWLLFDDDVNQASNGISIHFENFINETGDILALGNGTEHLNLNSNSLAYTVKWRHTLTDSFELTLKSYVGLSPWSVTNYNGGVARDDYNLFSYGGNFKLLIELRQIQEGQSKINGHVLSFRLFLYELWNYDIYNTPGFRTNSFFLYSRVGYSFPLSGRLSFSVSDYFLLLSTRLLTDMGPEFPDITRWYNNARFGIKISF